MLQWLGGTTVLALGSDLLAACLGKSLADRASDRPPDHPPDQAGASALDADVGVEAGPASASPFLPFQPGSGTDRIFANWYENTVDVQNLADILAGWSLVVDGLVARPLALGFADLLALDRQDQVTDFHCVEGWSVLDVPWNGVQLSRVLDLAGADADAAGVSFYSTGAIYSESLPMPVAREPKTLLGYGVDGSTLPLAHGFPVRLVVPRLLGYKNAKYLARIEVTNQPVNGFWEGYGYSSDGEVPASRLRPGKY